GGGTIRPIGVDRDRAGPDTGRDPLRCAGGDRTMATRVIDRMGTGGVAPAGLACGGAGWPARGAGLPPRRAPPRPPAPAPPGGGESLDPRRDPGGAPARPTAGWRLLAVIGLCLVLLFGVRTWQARGALASLDREIADRRAAIGHDVFGPPSNQAMLQAEATEP